MGALQKFAKSKRSMPSLINDNLQIWNATLNGKRNL
jgi:hypothetical protein